MSADETYLVWKFHLTSCTDKHLETDMSVLLFSSLLPNIILSANDSMWLVYKWLYKWAAGWQKGPENLKVMHILKILSM